MTNEELILKKLENLEAKIDPVLQFSENIKELKEDIEPLGKTAFHLLIKELQDVESDFQLEDATTLIKQTLRSTKDLTYSLQQFSNIIELLKDLEPLINAAVPQIIAYLDDLEKRGVFRMLKALMDVRAKASETYTPEDITRIGEVLVELLGLAKNLSDPNAMAFVKKASEIPSNIDLSKTEKIGPFGMLKMGLNSEVKEGLGVVMELTKAMGKLKEDKAVPQP